MAYEHVLTALVDPTRRELYRKLRHGDSTVSELAASARISQPAVSQHLRVLAEARLVTHERDGTRRYYRASTEGLAELREFIELLWDDVLAAYAADDPSPPKRGPSKIDKSKTDKKRKPR